MSEVARVLLLFGLLGQGCLLGANLFEAVVDVPNWSRPGGLAAYRAFIAVRNAGHFYRVLSPIVIVTLVAALAMGWGATSRNALMGASLGAAVIAEVLTVAYFFPRNARLFFAPELPSEGEQQRLVREWGRANVVRCAVVAIGAVAGLSGALGIVG